VAGQFGSRQSERMPRSDKGRRRRAAGRGGETRLDRVLKKRGRRVRESRKGYL